MSWPVLTADAVAPLFATLPHARRARRQGDRVRTRFHHPACHSRAGAMITCGA